MAILRKNGYLCAECRKYGIRKDARYVHHIVPYDERPDLALEPGNLVPLCAACHNRMHPEKIRIASAARKERNRYF